MLLGAIALIALPIWLIAAEDLLKPSSLGPLSLLLAFIFAQGAWERRSASRFWRNSHVVWARLVHTVNAARPVFETASGQRIVARHFGSQVGLTDEVDGAYALVVSKGTKTAYVLTLEGLYDHYGLTPSGAVRVLSDSSLVHPTARQLVPYGQVRDQVHSLLTEKVSPAVLEDALAAVADNRDSTALGRLGKLRSARDEAVLLMVIETLRALPDSAALELLESMREHSLEAVRNAARTAADAMRRQRGSDQAGAVSLPENVDQARLSLTRDPD